MREIASACTYGCSSANLCTYLPTSLSTYLPADLVRPRALPANAPSFPSQRTRVRASCDSLARGPAQSPRVAASFSLRALRGFCSQAHHQESDTELFFF
jgi:hypothetical protein